jgi:hypothetical protein
MLQLKKLGKLITTYNFFIILESLLTKQRHSLPLASLACHALSPPLQNGATLQTKPSDSAWAASSAASSYGIDKGKREEQRDGRCHTTTADDDDDDDAATASSSSSITTCRLPTPASSAAAVPTSSNSPPRAAQIFNERCVSAASVSASAASVATTQQRL